MATDVLELVAQVESDAMLICEGLCNPGIAALDRDVFEARCRLKADGPLSDTRLIDRLNLLRHTAHRYVREPRFKCLDCGSIRQWGGHRKFLGQPATVQNARG